MSCHIITSVLFYFSLLHTNLHIGFSYSMEKQFESIMFTTGQSVEKIILAGGSTYLYAVTIVAQILQFEGIDLMSLPLAHCIC